SLLSVLLSLTHSPFPLHPPPHRRSAPPHRRARGDHFRAGAHDRRTPESNPASPLHSYVASSERLAVVQTFSDPKRLNHRQGFASTRRKEGLDHWPGEGEEGEEEVDSRRPSSLRRQLLTFYPSLLDDDIDIESPSFGNSGEIMAPNWMAQGPSSG